MPQRTIETPVGPVRFTSAANRLVMLHIDAIPEPDIAGDAALLDDAQAQLIAYFAGNRESFDLPLAPAPTARGAVLRDAICSISAGETMTYGALADRVGSGARAIGQACARNPLPIIVPCHRIVASNGPGHYSGGRGLVTKSWLLAHESKEKMLWDL
ncbi:methylated-DNA--[protein]-cysteine S-methyltransferase [Sphingomonas sp. MMS24-J13]|uniref:methylated-DNA--[protein]-cysteine S-methyltransferase n=1 Tax=Sphingomonas sp. MMS24-J13 TaxID=3238686 RepID=UPI0038504E63